MDILLANYKTLCSFSVCSDCMSVGEQIKGYLEFFGKGICIGLKKSGQFGTS